MDEQIFVIKEMSKVYPDKLISEISSDILSKWSGVRPLILDNSHSDSKNVSRIHVIETSESGLISLMGGKWTTYRIMSQDCVDEVMNVLK